MRAAIYTRISQDKTGEELGVQRQEEVCRKLAEDRGWTVTEIYSDNDISAYDSRKRRPEYERLRADHDRNKFDALIVWDLDRLTRQPRQLEDWIDAAEKHGLALIESAGEADLSVPAGRMFARIKASVARQESEMKSARQKLAAQQRAKLGKPWGPRRPFGFQEDRVTHHPEEAETVRHMYASYLAGTGQREIVRRLNDRGIKTSMGMDWKQPALRTFLRNPRNAGLSSYKGEITGMAVWEPLVSRETWETTVALMDQQGAGRSPGGQAKHLLVGIAACGVCGGPVGTTYSPLHERQYACRNGSHVLRRADKVDHLAVGAVLRLIKRFGLNAAPSEDTTDDKQALITEQDTLNTRLNQLAVDYADGTLTKAQVRAANERITTRLNEISASLATPRSASLLQPLVNAADARATWESLELPARREIVRTLINVSILPTRRGAAFHRDDIQVTPKRN